jgi:RNA polymerase sigma factor (sigma-70 family)
MEWCPGCGAVQWEPGTCEACHGTYLSGQLDFLDLYEAYATPLQRFVRRLADDRGLPESALDTEGVVHDTFVVLLSGSGQPIRNPAAWLFTVARNQVSKAAAAQRRIVSGDAADHMHYGRMTYGRPVWATIESPLADAEDIRAAREVMHAIAGLPSHQRIATYLRQVEGWSLAEIGEYLDCAAATAGVHIHRGTTKVRDLVAPAINRPPYPMAPPPRRRSSAALAPALVGALAFLAAGLALGLGAPWWLAAVLVAAAAILAIAVVGVRR